MISIAICDDEEKDRNLLEEQLRRYFAEHPFDYCIQMFPDGESLLNEYSEPGGNFDLLFLDVYLKQLSGMETATRIRQYDDKAAVIFTTITPDFAVESYLVFALGYLLKPIHYEKMSYVLDAYTRHVQQEQEKTLLISINGSTHRLFFDEIVSVESRNTALFIDTCSGKQYHIYAKLNDLERELNNPRFLRCHQSYLVNMDHIKSAEDDFITDTGKRIVIRKREIRKIKEHYFQYLVHKNG